LQAHLKHAAEKLPQEREVLEAAARDEGDGSGGMEVYASQVLPLPPPPVLHCWTTDTCSMVRCFMSQVLSAFSLLLTYASQVRALLEEKRGQLDALAAALGEYLLKASESGHCCRCCCRCCLLLAGAPSAYGRYERTVAREDAARKAVRGADYDPW
jgi:hypothetical protein